ncbi:MAG: recombinase RecT [Candidatus Daviesbacteria bacterium]|nr:recombinase RecT [Candidatus Daviesbacteria bacterium]
MSNELVKKERLEIENYALQAKEAFLEVADDKIWSREIGFALQILRGNAAAFSKCDPASIKDAVTNVALTRATLSPSMQQAFLIPRSVKGVMKCCLDYSYRGLVKIAVDNSDSIYDIDAVCVYQNDEFYFEQGLNPVLKHIPCLSDRGEIVAVYAIAILHHGIKKFLVLNKEDVDKARKTSQAPNSPMWTQWYDEGARKTAVKRLYKLLPQSERMTIAVSALNEHEGLDLQPSKAAEVKERFKFLPEAKPAEDVPTDFLRHEPPDRRPPLTTEIIPIDSTFTTAELMDAQPPITEADIEDEVKPQEKKEGVDTWVKGLVTNFVKKEGKDAKGKPYTKYDMTINNIRLSSFSNTIAKDAQAATGGIEVIVEYEVKGKYNNIKTLSIVEPEARDWQKEMEEAPDSTWLDDLWAEFEASKPNGPMIVKMRRIRDRKISAWKEGK